MGRGIAVVEAALDAGITWIDTSERYHDGRNESLIGDVLQRVPREMLVASKVAPAPRGSGFRPDEIRAACEQSLQRLRRDRIDIYFLHWPDETGVPLAETWGAMSELVDNGLVRAIGLSNHGIDDVECCHAQRRVDAIQDGLSLIDYLGNRELFARCGELGIGGVAFEPLGSGVLSGRTIDEVRQSWADYTDWGFYQRLLEGENGDRSGDVVDALRVIAGEAHASVAQVAIAWVLNQPGVTAALAGSRSEQHTRQNAAAAGLDLRGLIPSLETVIPRGPTVQPSGGAS